MRSLCVGVVAVFLVGGCPPAPAEPVAAEVRADRVILLDIAANGASMLSVGERGAILTSVDDGTHWTAVATPTTKTLTALAFARPGLGIAVGHGGTILRTGDGGASWSAVKSPDLEGASLLGVTAVSDSAFVAYGAFGLVLTSTDEGVSWTRRPVAGPGLGADFDRHIYRVLALDANRLLLAGESGTLALSPDGGETWQALTSPYQGSFFGALQAQDGAILVFGMRANAYRSTDLGKSWTKIDMGPTATAFNNGRVLADGRIVLVGNNGQIAYSLDHGKSFSLGTLARPVSLAQFSLTAAGAPVFVGDGGVAHAPSFQDLVQRPAR